MKYDIIVIGAGSGGLNIASFMNRVGFKVLLIDKSDKNIGGDCLNYGCVPSKALIHVSKLIAGGKEAEKFGLKTSGDVNLKKVMDYVKSRQDIFRKHETAAYFNKLGIDVALGDAKFASRNEVRVKNKIYQGKRIVIATGSRPRKLNIKGLERLNYLTNETIFDLKTLPKHLLIIGGGPIGLELGQAFNRLGSKVTIVTHGQKFLPKEDPVICKVLAEKVQRDGIKTYFNSAPLKCTAKNELIIHNKQNKKTKLRFDQVLVSIGRELNTDLDLSLAGIKTENKKIVVDDYLRTSNRRVLVCGDIAGSYQFTHAAELHAGVILNNFFSPKKKKVNYDNFSWVTFTDPEIATFGLNEEQLKERKIKHEKIVANFSEDDRAITDDYRYGKAILYISKNMLMGGSIVASNAGELVQEMILANKTGLDIKNIFNKIYPYPTAGRINKRMISNYLSKKLTGGAKRLLKFIY